MVNKHTLVRHTHAANTVLHVCYFAVVAWHSTGLYGWVAVALLVVIVVQAVVGE